MKQRDSKTGSGAPTKKRGSTTAKWTSISLASLSLALAAWYVFVSQTLPSDEEMIAHFGNHRKEFEEVVQVYRMFAAASKPEKPMPRWDDAESVQKLMRAAKIDHIATGRHVWFPNSYEVDSHQKVRELVAQGGLEALNPYFSLLIFISGKEYFHYSPLFGEYYKAYYHIPQPTRKRDGKLLSPTHNAEWERISESTDVYPWVGEPGRCVLRSIAVHWYVAVCKSFTKSLL
jgi:hypothetical protein